MKNFFKEFQDFINRGSVVDMAVGVIIGGAFAKIVSSLVNDVIMPLVGVILGGIDISSASITVGGAVIKYGLFLQNIIDFLIIAFVIFMIIKIMNRMRENVKKLKGEEEVEVDEEPVSEEIKLMREMRDLIKNRNLFK